ncbi:MAG: Hsp20/alpha crystallin family protein [Candidatus Riflebacteria bacterium]|nr:Hsp20/alpha crystallin family protein [Candidatus Riflebacteria bacterium]
MTEKNITNQEKDSKLIKREITRQAENYVTPATDIYEDDKGLRMLVDLPGVTKDGLNLHVNDNVLTIEAKVDVPQKDKSYILREFSTPSYYRQFDLCELVDEDAIEAELKNGVLHVSLPKAKENMPKQIQVKVEG